MAPGTEATAERGGVGFPPWLIYIVGFLGGVALELAFPVASLPFAFAVIAAVVGISIWLALDGAAMLHFSREETSMVAATPVTTLVTAGPYRFTRNPMYLGMAFLYAGLALAFGMIWALALLAVVLVVVDRLVIPPEERYLEAKFGDEYRSYKRRVRRWI